MSLPSTIQSRDVGESPAESTQPTSQREIAERAVTADAVPLHEETPPAAEAFGSELLEGQRWTTIGELGNVLPLAIGVDRTFTFKQANLRSALDASRHQPEGGQSKPYLQFAHQLASSLESLQGQRPKTVDEMALAVRRLPIMTMLHALCRLSIRNGQDEARPRVRCPAARCRHLQDARIKVSQIRVRDWGQRSTLPAVEIELLQPIEWPQGQMATSLTIEPAPFDALCDLGGGASGEPVEVTAATLTRAVVGISTVDGRISVPLSALEQLGEQDYQDLDTEHDLLSGGPVMLGECKCERCGVEMYVPLPWNQLSFFGQAPGASRSSRRRLRR